MTRIAMLFFIFFAIIAQPIEKICMSNGFRQIDVKNGGSILSFNKNNLLYNSSIKNELYTINIDTNRCTFVGNITVSYPEVQTHDNSYVLFDQLNAELLSYNYIENEMDWKLKIIHNININPKIIRHLLPAIHNNHLLFRYYASGKSNIMYVDLNDGHIKYPSENIIDSIDECNGYNYIIDKYLVMNNGTEVELFNMDNKNLIYNYATIRNKEGCLPDNLINNDVFFYNDSIYIQYNAIAYQKDKKSFLLQINCSTGEIVDIIDTVYSSGIWIKDNYAFIFPLSSIDNHLLVLNLVDKTISKTVLNNYMLPLGLYNNHIVYTTSDSIVIEDKDGNNVFNQYLGNINYDNCKLFDNNILFLDKDKLTIIDVNNIIKEHYINSDLISIILKYIFSFILRIP